MSPPRGWAVTSVALAAVVLGGLLAGCTRSGAAPGPSTAATAGSSAPPASGMRACPQPSTRKASGAKTLPALVLPCLGGGELDLGKAPGMPTVVNLWASWCGPCREELPLVQQFSAAAGNRIRVLGVVSKDGRRQAISFARDAGATFPSAFDGDGRLMTRLGLRGLPYTYLLDAGGAVVYTQVGPVHSVQELQQLVADHLGVQP